MSTELLAIIVNGVTVLAVVLYKAGKLEGRVTARLDAMESRMNAIEGWLGDLGVTQLAGRMSPRR